MRKQTFCICKNKGADQLGNCEANYLLCFCYTDSTISILSKSKISSLFKPSFVLVQLSLCQNYWEPQSCFSHDAAHFIAWCCQKNICTGKPIDTGIQYHFIVY